MITFTKEQLIEHLRTRIEHRKGLISSMHIDRGYRDYLKLELLSSEIALASLEAEAVAYVDPFAFHNFNVYRAGETDNKRMGREWMWANPDAGLIPVYTAPPAPANAEPVAWLWSHRKHPSEVSLVRPEDDERAEGAHWSGWSCEALYAEPPAPVSVPDEDLLHMAASAIEDLLSNKDRYCAGVWVDIPAKLRRAAMLQRGKS